MNLLNGRLKKSLIIGFLLMILGLYLQPVFAHEIIPQDVLNLIKDNPNITAEQIDAYINASQPNTAQIAPSSSSATHTILGVKDPNASFWNVVLEFIKLGIQHILSGPDHILFVLSLLLVFINLKSMLKLVTAFTIAHSITLILAGTGFFTLSSRIVEPLIAFSIAYMAITTVFLDKPDEGKKSWNKFWLIFFFGLFHGLGFAGLLQNFAIPQNRFIASLLFFNVGIEIGQLIILALALPYIYLLRHKPWYPTFVKCAAILISQVALLWFVERLFGLNLINFLIGS